MAFLLPQGVFTEFKMIFDILDCGSRGFLTAHQLTAIMNQFGYVHDPEEVQKMIDLVDCDGTGNMGFATFCAALLASIHMMKTSRTL